MKDVTVCFQDAQQRQSGAPSIRDWRRQTGHRIVPNAGAGGKQANGGRQSRVCVWKVGGKFERIMKVQLHQWNSMRFLKEATHVSGSAERGT
ncbi:MAG: hypothetical protein ACKV0T_08260, partial [Planctomycetales bacterium]